MAEVFSDPVLPLADATTPGEPPAGDEFGFPDIPRAHRAVLYEYWSTRPRTDNTPPSPGWPLPSPASADRDRPQEGADTSLWPARPGGPSADPNHHGMAAGHGAPD
jgi:hypothetical protein